MKKKLIIMAMLVGLLALGLTFISCDNESPGNDDSIPAQLVGDMGSRQSLFK